MEEIDQKIIQIAREEKPETIELVIKLTEEKSLRQIKKYATAY